LIRSAMAPRVTPKALARSDCEYHSCSISSGLYSRPVGLMRASGVISQPSHTPVSLVISLLRVEIGFVISFLRTLPCGDGIFFFVEVSEGDLPPPESDVCLPLLPRFHPRDAFDSAFTIAVRPLAQC